MQWKFNILCHNSIFYHVPCTAFATDRNADTANRPSQSSSTCVRPVKTRFCFYPVSRPKSGINITEATTTTTSRSTRELMMSAISIMWSYTAATKHWLLYTWLLFASETTLPDGHINPHISSNTQYNTQRYIYSNISINIDMIIHIHINKYSVNKSFWTNFTTHQSLYKYFQ